jgi:hypothetical protein
MSAPSEQDSGYIFAMRTLATNLLKVADGGLGRDKEYGACFAGEDRLTPGSFTGSDAGLDKAKILAALSALSSDLNTWLDTANRRSNLQALRFVS